jgi:hypothetical protein
LAGHPRLANSGLLLQELSDAPLGLGKLLLNEIEVGELQLRFRELGEILLELR